ncbi:uncharacterized protein LOC131806709, partial [Musca domestica]|uniref:Uncharacterized protein LOC131806709 n=1 Tax=Musca domestica TaxID=7370 RepID=A0ABM3VNC8_MUSDO
VNSCRSRASLSYVLFQYREQLRQRVKQEVCLNRTKLKLTDKLIKKTAPHIESCSMDDVRAVNRGLMLRKKLKEQIKERKSSTDKGSLTIKMDSSA